MTKSNIPEGELPSSEKVKLFEMLFPMISSDLSEIRDLSKKKQDEPLNKFKVKTINKKLEKIKTILIDEPSYEFLELLDDDTLPSNSDAVLNISQFIEAMKQFRSKYFTKDSSDFEVLGEHFSWKTKK